MADGKEIVVVAEAANGAPIALVFEMLGLGRRLAAQTGGVVCAVVLGQPLPEVTTSLIAHGADRVLVMSRGIVVEEISRDELDERRIIAAIIGRGSAHRGDHGD